MTKAALLVALCLLALLSLAAGAPTTFIGGSFFQAAGLHSPDFAAFDVAANEWSAKPTPLGGTIHSIDAAGNGVFAAGTFTQVGESASFGVAYFDGTKWCPVRQGLGGTGEGRSVACDSDTSCWVAGTFVGVRNTNLDDVNGDITNFAHYVFNTGSGEWEVDVEAFEWNNSTLGNLLPDNTDFDKLEFIGSGSNLFFFASTGAGASATIYRGSATDNGWWEWATGASLDGAGSILDWSVDPAGTAVYAVRGTGDEALHVATGSRVTAACGSDCNTPTDSDDWAPVIPAAEYNETLFVSLTHVFATTGDRRYLIGSYDPDGTGQPDFGARYRVLLQSGSAVPTLVGDAFTVLANQAVLSRVLTTEAGDPFVVGTFTGGNLFYPTDPLTTDIDGVTGDIRLLDRLTGLAVFNSSLGRWVQWGAGGVSGTPSGNQRLAYVSATNTWYLADDAVEHVYNLHADGAMYLDDDSGLTDPLFPILTRYLQTRPLSDGTVWEILCETSDCSAVFIGGDFAFHGADTFGAIVRAVVKRSGDPELSAVGGGLWDTIEDHYLEDENFQVGNGQVYALTLANGFLYAGGEFSRTAPANGFLCLNNIARIDASALTGNWENLAGGCDNAVYDLTEWDGRLYAAGAFHKCGDVIVNFVAAYSHRDETPAWHTLHLGLDATAYSLEPFQGRLIVGGDLTHAGGVPVNGIASWDGFKWRALLPACTSDCTPGELAFYFNVLKNPTGSIVDLQRDRSGRYLFATATYDNGGPVRYLSRWQYSDGDFGQWLVKGQIDYNPGHDNKGHGVAIGINDRLLVAGADSATAPYDDPNTNLGVWDQNDENSGVGLGAVGDQVFVVRGPDGGDAGSASTLSSSPLAPLLAFVGF